MTAYEAYACIVYNSDALHPYDPRNGMTCTCFFICAATHGRGSTFECAISQTLPFHLAYQ